MGQLGQLLSTKRKSLGLPLSKIAKDLNIKEENLKALEEGDWQSLPEATFTKGFLKNYAEYLGLEVNRVLAHFRREYDEAKFSRKSPLFSKRRLMLTPNRIGRLIFILGVLVFAAYLFIQYLSILSAPRLEVDLPRDDSTTSLSIVQVAGKTDPEATVAISGDFVPVDKEGNFFYQYSLKEGRNQIEIIASKRLSPKARVVRVVRLAS